MEITLGRNSVMPQLGEGSAERLKLRKWLVFESIDGELKDVPEIQQSASSINHDGRNVGFAPF